VLYMSDSGVTSVEVTAITVRECCISFWRAQKRDPNADCKCMAEPRGVFCITMCCARRVEARFWKIRPPNERGDKAKSNFDGPPAAETIILFKGHEFLQYLVKCYIISHQKLLCLPCMNLGKKVKKASKGTSSLEPKL